MNRGWPTPAPDRDHRQHWEALAEAVRARRLHLGLRQEDIEPRGGPSTATVRNVEQAARTAYARRTFVQLEQALQWQPGTVRALLDAAPADPAGPHVTVPHHSRLRDRVCEALDLDDNVTDDAIVLALLLRLNHLDRLEHPA